MGRKIVIGIAVFFLLFANFGVWLSNNIYNANNFKNNILTTFHKQEVRDAIASSVVDRALTENPGLKQIVSSPAQSAISGMLASPYLTPVIDKAAEKLQSYITRGQEEVSIDLSPVNNILTALSRATSGQDQAPQIQNTNITLVPANAFPNLNRWLGPITSLGPILGVISIVTLGVIFYQTEDKYYRLRQYGWFLLAGVILNLLLIPFIGSMIPQSMQNGNAAVIVTQAYNVFTLSYYNQLTLLGLISVILLGAGYLLPRYYQTKAKREVA
jgi:hypothetical protein